MVFLTGGSSKKYRRCRSWFCRGKFKAFEPIKSKNFCDIWIIFSFALCVAAHNLFFHPGIFVCVDKSTNHRILSCWSHFSCMVLTTIYVIFLFEKQHEISDYMACIWCHVGLSCLTRARDPTERKSNQATSAAQLQLANTTRSMWGQQDLGSSLTAQKIYRFQASRLFKVLYIFQAFKLI